ncbi:MAG: TRAP transporter TatT component family protein [Gammaproteobacteria bacterium]
MRLSPLVPLFAAALLTQGGCSLFIQPAVDRASDNLSAAILNQDDPATVRDGAPAYLLLMDSLVEGPSPDPELLSSASGLYSAYAAVFVEDPERAARLAARARRYAARALCLTDSEGCGFDALSFDEIPARLQKFDQRDVPALYAYGVAWLVYIRTHADDWKAIADLPKVEALLERILVLDETYERGSTHLYLGILKTLRPPALGGRPEEAREHFERADELSEGRDLSIKVEFARNYARLLYDRELHDRLLTEVIEADPYQPRLTLTNTLAQQQAEELLASADDYF